MLPKEILRIIAACKTSGVKTLKTEGLELSFFTGEAEKVMTDPEPIILKEQELKTAETTALKALVDEEIDDQLASLQIDDPAAFEDLLQEITFSEEDRSEEVIND